MYKTKRNQVSLKHKKRNTINLYVLVIKKKLKHYLFIVHQSVEVKTFV